MSFGPFTQWLRGQFDATPGARATQVAATSGVNEGYLSALRSGRNARPSQGKARDLALAFAQLRDLSGEQANVLVEEALKAVAATSAGHGAATTVSPSAPSVDGAASMSWDAYFQALKAAVLKQELVS